MYRELTAIWQNCLSFGGGNVACGMVGVSDGVGGSKRVQRSAEGPCEAGAREHSSRE